MFNEFHIGSDNVLCRGLRTADLAARALMALAHTTAAGEIRRLMRWGGVIILVVPLLFIGWHCLEFGRLMFFGKTTEYTGATAEQQLGYWTFPGAAALAGDIRGNDFRLGQGRLLHFSFYCDSVAFQALCAGIVAQEKIAHCDSGVIKRNECEMHSTDCFAFADNDAYHGTLSSVVNAPDWWFSAEDADSKPLMEFDCRDEGWGELLYMPETSRAWLYLAF